MDVCGACEASSLQRLPSPNERRCEHLLQSQTVTSLYDFQYFSGEEAGSKTRAIAALPLQARSSCCPRQWGSFQRLSSRLIVHREPQPSWSWMLVIHQCKSTTHKHRVRIVDVRASVPDNRQSDPPAPRDHMEPRNHRQRLRRFQRPGGAVQEETYYTFPDIPCGPGSASSANFSVGLSAYLACNNLCTVQCKALLTTTPRLSRMILFEVSGKSPRIHKRGSITSPKVSAALSAQSIRRTVRSTEG